MPLKNSELVITFLPSNATVLGISIPSLHPIAKLCLSSKVKSPGLEILRS